MMVTTVLVTIAAILTTSGAGYLFGVHLGRRSRSSLAAEIQRERERARSLELSLTEQRTLQTSAERVREEMRTIMAPLMGQQASVEHLQNQMQQLVSRISNADKDGEQIEALRQELRRTLAPLLDRERESQQDLRAFMSDVLSPLLENERRGKALQSIAQTRRGREHLPTLLDTMARRGGFSAILLSDEMGLPLAATSGAKDTDVLAGVSSIILTLADRVTRSGGPTPTAVLIRDTSNAFILHRIFSVSAERFLVTAVSNGAPIASDALDPALPALERALEKNKAA